VTGRQYALEPKNALDLFCAVTVAGLLHLNDNFANWQNAISSGTRVIQYFKCQSNEET